VPFNTRETVALETPARIETSSIVAIHRFLISRDKPQFITDIQGICAQPGAKNYRDHAFAGNAAKWFFHALTSRHRPLRARYTGSQRIFQQGIGYAYSALIRRAAARRTGGDVALAGLWRRNAAAAFLPLIAHSQTPEALPLTFIAVEGETLGTVGLWRCDLISRQDLFPWMAALYVAPHARGRGIAGKLQQHVIDYARRPGTRSCISTPPAAIFMSVLAGSILVKGWITRPPRQPVSLRLIAFRRRHHRVTANQRRAE
jgi:GNAT superfamily N-acetyltransferase